VNSYTAIDLFSGAGGATQGLSDAGFRMVAAVENDEIAAKSYSDNHPETRVEIADIRTVNEHDLRLTLGLDPGELTLLKACPPCQGFSSLANGAVDSARNDLVLDVGRFVKEFMPAAVLLENVPGLSRDQRLADLICEIELLGYAARKYIVQATDYGVPQRRKRLIVMAVRGGVADIFPDDIRTLLPETFDTSRTTAGEALDGLAVAMGIGDGLNRSRKHSTAVVARMAAIPVNGNRFDLPLEHQLACHTRLEARGLRNATSAYGRIRRDEPAPTMTTRCTTPSCGSFVHPTEDRGLTLREAASLQTFPANYKFQGTYGQIEKQIGNAVPVHLAHALGSAMTSLLGKARPAGADLISR
jgi:DNA (cytosine-5)-methyltransferase 1